MKKYTTVIFSLVCLSPGFSQNTGNSNTGNSGSLISTLRDSASYGVGCFIVNYNRQQGITGINSAMVLKAIRDKQSGSSLLIKPQEAEIIIRNYQQYLAKKQQAPQTVTLINNPGAILKNLVDSASYAIGLSTLDIYEQYDITNINEVVAARAIDDLQEKNPQLISDQEINRSVMAYQQQFLLEKIKPAIEAGNKLLEENKKRPGVITTSSGLQYEVITQGTGPVPAERDTFIANYRGTLIDGKEFDNSYKRGSPLIYPVNAVIIGWTEALKMMPVGSKWKLWIPYQLGYGANGTPNIPGGSLLIFEIELLGIKGK